MDNWNTFSDGAYIMKILCRSVYIAITYRIDDAEYGASYIFGYMGGSNRPYILKKTNSVWTEETLITKNDLQVVIINDLQYDTSTNIDGITITQLGQKFDVNEWIPALLSYSSNHNFNHHFYRFNGYWVFWATLTQKYTIAMYKYIN